MIKKSLVKILGSLRFCESPVFFRMAYLLTTPIRWFIEPKIISLLDGGLGSQMRQFALGYCVAAKTGYPLYLDTKFFREKSTDINGNRNRFFLLFETFPRIRELYQDKVIKENQDKFVRYFCSDMDIKREYYDYNPELFKRRPRFIRSYYENASYFKGYEEELRNLFRFELSLNEYEREIAERLSLADNSCAVHVRKGDYVGSEFDVCSDRYFLDAMEKVRSRHNDVEFFIFSNDEEYARQLCKKTSAKTTVVESRSEENPCVDLYLLTLSKHSIISNSNFSWMGAFLRENAAGMTIMPSIWKRAGAPNRDMSSDVFRLKDWIQLEV